MDNIAQRFDQRSYIPFWATPADPAPGAQFLFTNLEERILELLHISFRFAASGAAASRVVQVIATNGAVRAAWSIPITTHTAGVTADYIFSVGLAMATVTGANAIRTSPLRTGIILTQLNTIQTLVESIQAADQISNVNLYFKEWLSGL